MSLGEGDKELHRILVGKSLVKLSLGRRKRWNGNIRIHLKEVGLDGSG
jgi:hypothetical protein